MGEILADRIPLALERIGRLLGDDRFYAGKGLREDLMALHAGAEAYVEARKEVARLRSELAAANKLLHGGEDGQLSYHDLRHRLLEREVENTNLKAELDAANEELRIAKGDLTPSERYSQDFVNGVLDARQDNA